jgi:hypothetical protein
MTMSGLKRSEKRIGDGHITSLPEGASQKEKAYKDLVKVAAAFRLLQTGRVSVMSDEEFKQFMEWLG